MLIVRYLLCAVALLGAGVSRAAEAVVVDPEGKPVADAEVTIFDTDREEQSVRSDAEGRVALPEGPRRTFMMIAQGGDGLSCMLRVPRPPEGKTPELLRLELAPSRRIDVEVKTAAGDPAAGASVLALGDWAETVRAVTDNAGAATLFLPAKMSLRHVLATSPDGVDYALFRRPDALASDPYQLPHDFEGIVSLRLTPTRPIAVRVLDAAGAAIEGATVNPWYLDLPNHGDSAHLERLWQAKTDADGAVRFTTFPTRLEKPLTLWVQKEGYKRLRLPYDPSRDLTTLMATLQSQVRVTGRVIGPDGEAPSGVTVVFHGRGYDLDGFGGSVQPSDVGADGSFSIDVDPNQFYAFVAMADGLGTPLVTRVVRSESPEPVELRLEPATKVTGTVVDSVTGEPVAEQYVTLYRHAGNAYHELPEEEQLPNPTDSRLYISAYATQQTRTDNSGRFEFSTGPGQHYFITDRSLEDSLQFELAPGEESYTATLKVKPQLTGTIKGKVVLASDPDKPVAEVRIEDSFNYFTGAVSDANGEFELPLADTKRTMGAFTAGRKLGAVIDVEPFVAAAELRLAPTASVAGTLSSSESKVCAGEEVVVYVRVENSDGTFTHRFQRSATTDDEGAFSVDGIAVGVQYDVTVVSDRDGEGHARGWSQVTKFRADKPGMHELGNVSYTVHHEPKIEDYVARVFADDPGGRLGRRLADAKLAYQQVLLILGDPESDAVKRLVSGPYFVGPWSDKDEVGRAMADYLLIGAKPSEKALIEELRLTPPAPEGATLAVLDADRRVVATTSSTELAKEGELDPERVVEFLKTRRAPLPDAEEAYAAALADAERDDKRVLAVVSGAGCAPCTVLSRFLDKHADLVGKDYVVVKLDARMPHGSDVIERVRGDGEGGVPWFAILDAHGKRLADSTAPEGNIGYPDSDSAKAHFRKMIESTRVRLNDKQIEAIVSAL